MIVSYIWWYDRPWVNATIVPLYKRLGMNTVSPTQSIRPPILARGELCGSNDICVIIAWDSCIKWNRKKSVQRVWRTMMSDIIDRYVKGWSLTFLQLCQTIITSGCKRRTTMLSSTAMTYLFAVNRCLCCDFFVLAGRYESSDNFKEYMNTIEIAAKTVKLY